MKKFYTLLALLLFTLGSATAYADAVDEWKGKYIQSIGSSITTISDLKSVLTTESDGTTVSGMFIMHDGSNFGYAKKSEDYGHSYYVRGTAYSSSDDLSSVFCNKTGLMSYVVKITQISADDNTFYIQTYESEGGTVDYLTNFYSDWGWSACGYGESQGDASTWTFADVTDGGISMKSSGAINKNAGYLGIETMKSSEIALTLYPVTLGETTNVTYTINDANGNELGTYEEEVAIGKKFPELETAGWYTITGYPTNVVSTTNNTATLTLTYSSDITIPFTISSSIDDAAWMTLATRSSNYLAIQGTTAGAKIYSSNFNSQKVPAEAFTSYDNVVATHLWCITGNPITGFQIINKFNGLAIGYDGTGNGATLSMKATSATNTRYTIHYTGEYWDIAPVGTTQYASDYQGDSNSDLAFWYQGAKDDPGCRFFFSTTDDLTLTAANIPTVSGTKYVGEFNFWKDGISSMTETGEALYNAVGNIEIEDGTYYQIKSGVSAMPYPYFSSESNTADTEGNVTSGSMIRNTASDALVPQLWKFEKNESTSKYLIRNANTGTALGQHTGNGVSNAIKLLATDADESTAGSYNIVTGNYGVMQWMLQETTDGGTHRLNALSGASNDNKVVTDWNGNSDSDTGDYWYIIPVTEIPLTIYDDTQYASACYPFAVELPTGLTAYVVSAEDDSEATLTAIDTQIIPAKTPVFIAANDDATATSTDSDAGTKTYTLTISNSTTTYDSTNKLKGTTVSRTGFSKNTFYALATNGSKAVLKKNGTVETIPVNKAYLPFTDDANTKAMTLSLSLGDEATGINAISTSEQTEGAQTYYDLNGRRVLYPTHGIYVKGNGQKVYIK